MKSKTYIVTIDAEIETILLKIVGYKAQRGEKITRKQLTKDALMVYAKAEGIELS